MTDCIELQSVCATMVPTMMRWRTVRNQTRTDLAVSGFSNFKQLFAHGQEFAYSIDDIARYYAIYERLMRHWDTVLPGKVLRIEHEDVVDDLEGNVRRILDFCRLEFQPQCIEFH